jgi:hypothetical protein
MTLTSYTKYCLENGDKLNVFVIVERATPAQLQALTNCDAKYDKQQGYWFVEMAKENYKAKCKALRGLKMAFFTKAA